MDEHPLPPHDRLARRLGLTDAVVLGLGSMLGAGVFAAFGPAAASAGSGLLIALLLAGAVAYCNAIASARLASRYPESGGTYVYGRRRLGDIWGFLAGWGFVVGKTASCAAMALTVGVYAWPQHPNLLALATVVALTAVNYFGVTKTARVTRILVALTLLSLTAVVMAAAAGGTATTDNFFAWAPRGALGIAQAAGFLFFAFAGYARIATLGEEVREPQRTIPRAIPIALGLVLVIYALVGATALAAVGPVTLAVSSAPLATAASAGDLAFLEIAVRVGGTIAALGALLSLLAGVGRTTLAMARDRELPHSLASVHPRHHVPHRAQLVIGALIAVTAAVFDLRGAVGFSSFAVLLYYAVTNASAFGLSRRIGLRVVAVGGFVGCVVLAFTLPAASVLAGVAVLALGAIGRTLARVAGR